MANSISILNSIQVDGFFLNKAHYILCKSQTFSFKQIQLYVRDLSP